jgi:DNA mismatch repair protein MSH6
MQVWWQNDDAWYTGSVASYDVDSGKHLVEYDDGEEEELTLAQEKYEILPGED